MKKRFLFLLVPLLALSLQIQAYVVGDIIRKDGIYYRVENMATHTVAAIACEEGVTTVNIPAKVRENGSDEEFTVTIVGTNDFALLTGKMSRCFENATSITLPETIVEIRLGAIRKSKITTFHIPASVKTINRGLNYYSVNTLESYTVDEANPYFQSIDGVLYSKSGKQLWSYPRNKAGITEGTEKKFYVPDNVDTIIAGAFLVNQKLTTIEIPASVTTIEHATASSNANCNITRGAKLLRAFKVHPDNPKYCDLDSVLFNKDKDTLVAFPSQRHKNQPYHVPSDVKVILNSAFDYTYISELYLTAVKTIEMRAIVENQSLETIHIPATLLKITDRGIVSNPILQNYIVDENNPNYKDIDGVLFSDDGDTLISYPIGRPATTYEIPSGTKVLGNAAFRSHSKITSIVIPNTVTKIDMSCFNVCTNLKEVTFEPTSQLKVIVSGAFRESGIERITLPASLQTLEHHAFVLCKKLKEVTVEDGSQLTAIAYNTFQGCEALEDFTFLGTANNLVTIGQYAFDDCVSLKAFEIPASVTLISNNAFSQCRAMHTAIFPDNSALKEIRFGAFAESGIQEITLPNALKLVGDDAFRNCDVLEAAHFGKNANSISPIAFRGCKLLQHITVDRLNTTYSAVDGMLLTKDKETLVIFPAGKANDTFTLLAPSIKTIGDYAFYECENLRNVTIPNKVTSIGKRAFGFCENLNTVTMLCDELIDPDNIKQALNEAAFDDGVTTPGYSQFPRIILYMRHDVYDDYTTNHAGAGDKYKQFYSKFGHIQPSFRDGDVEYIPVSDNAVDLLDVPASLDDVTYVVPHTVSDGSIDYAVSIIGDYAFQHAPTNIKEVVLPGEVKYIGAKAFITDITNNKSTVESVFLINGDINAETFSTVRFELDDTGNDYSEFAPTTNVYVKKRVFNSTAFQDAIKRYTEDAKTHAGDVVRPATSAMFDYKIPGISLSKTYGTFAREFDVDLEDFHQEYGTGKVVAFTTTVSNTIYQGAGDGVTEGQWYIRMYSINNGDYADGTYIPAGTGVLLKSMEGGATPGDYYYTIGDNDAAAGATNIVSPIMNGVTRKNLQIAGEDGVYIMSGGVFKHLTTESQPFSFPLHKAYLKLPTEMYPGSANAKVVMSFDDSEPVVTTIDELLGNDSLSTEAVYDMQGRRVTPSHKGLYIKNGKKVVIK